MVMSALGQKQTYAAQYAMSALPPKADMCSALGDVRFVPIADIERLSFYMQVTTNWHLSTPQSASIRRQLERSPVGHVRLPSWHMTRLSQVADLL